MAKKVILSVTNDISFDQRVDKMCSTIHGMGFEVKLIGRLLPDSPKLERVYQTKRIKLLFTKGALFYAFFNFRLFFVLLFSKVDIYHANDLDTLLANYLASKIRGKKLIYDSHEYFLGVPEIQGRAAKKVWSAIEHFIFPRLNAIFTVNQSIADLYEKDYSKKLKVVRNLPLKRIVDKVKSRADLKIPEDKKVVILQGAGINVDRGSEELLEAIALSNDYVLYIVGTGEVINDLKDRAKSSDLNGKVIFVGRVPYQEMMQYTLNSDVGVTLDKDTNINYRFSLPNKVFDYMKAGIPVLASNLKEVANIVNSYNVGLVIENHKPQTILNGLDTILSNKTKLEVFSKNGLNGIEELNWEREVTPVKEIYSTFIQ